MDALLPLLTQYWYLVILGLLVVIPFMVNQLGKWRKPIDAVNSPMSITHKTDKTPAQLNSEAQFAKFKRRLFWATVVVVIWMALHFYDPELASNIDSFLFQMLVSIADALSRLFASLSELLVNSR